MTIPVRVPSIRGMSSFTSPKKPAPKDWHPADIQAALRKAGWTFRSLSREHHYCANLADAMHRPWLRAEQLIAAAIGVRAQDIWPSRFNADGTRREGLLAGRSRYDPTYRRAYYARNRERIQAQQRAYRQRRRLNGSTRTGARNVSSKKAA